MIAASKFSVAFVIRNFNGVLLLVEPKTGRAMFEIDIRHVTCTEISLERAGQIIAFAVFSMTDCSPGDQLNVFRGTRPLVVEHRSLTRRLLKAELGQERTNVIRLTRERFRVGDIVRISIPDGHLDEKIQAWMPIRWIRSMSLPHARAALGYRKARQQFYEAGKIVCALKPRPNGPKAWGYLLNRYSDCWPDGARYPKINTARKMLAEARRIVQEHKN